jgi:uncharacterized glyoxalase superfamily protein PhnB
MSSNQVSSLQGSTIISCLRYRDAHAMIDWLCKAFGFEKRAVYDDEKGGVAHAQLVYAGGMLMVSSINDESFGKHFVELAETGGRETQCAYVIVADCRAHYEKARAAGAEITDDYVEKDYGGAGYGCRDPEGHVWSFGSYDPWQSE